MTIKSAELKKAEYKDSRDVIEIVLEDGTYYWIGEDEIKCIEYLRRIMPR